MAVTISNLEYLRRGTYNLMYAEIAMDASYLASGEQVNASDFGFSVIKGIWLTGNPAGYIVEPVRSSDILWLLKFYSFSNTTNTVLGDMVSAKDLSAVTCRCLVLGR